MNEVISSILETEKKSEEMIKNAQIEARSLKLSGDVSAVKIREDAVKNFKSLRVKEIELAEKKASEKYNEIIKNGEERALALVTKSKENLVKVADKIVEGILR